jgi:hypothetical protein
VVSAAHELGARVGCRLWGVGAAFWCPKWPVPLSRLFGGGLGSHRNPLKFVGTASRWCEGVDHHHVPAKCARGYPRKRPGSTPNPKSGSEIGIVKASGRMPLVVAASCSAQRATCRPATTTSCSCSYQVSASPWSLLYSLICPCRRARRHTPPKHEGRGPRGGVALGLLVAGPPPLAGCSRLRRPWRRAWGAALPRPDSF